MSDAYRIVITPQAGEDLEGIYDYIAKDAPDNAAGVIERILNALDSLKQFPHRTVIERQNPNLRHPVRTITVRPYVVYFRVIDEEKVVRILHVMHGARRRPRRVN